MVDPRLAWFAIGTLFGAALYGWRPGESLRPLSRRSGNPPPPGRKPAPPTGPPAPGMRREWLWSPSQMAECGGPCWEAQDPRRCDCGALWRDVPAAPAKPQFPPPRKIREDFL